MNETPAMRKIRWIVIASACFLGALPGVRSWGQTCSTVITLRGEKGSALSFNEVDDNFLQARNICAGLDTGPLIVAGDITAGSTSSLNTFTFLVGDNADAITMQGVNPEIVIGSTVGNENAYLTLVPGGAARDGVIRFHDSTDDERFFIAFNNQTPDTLEIGQSAIGSTTIVEFNLDGTTRFTPNDDLALTLRSTGTSTISTFSFLVGQAVPGFVIEDSAENPLVSVNEDGDIVQSGPNGSTWKSTDISEEITLNTGGTTTDSAANLLPADSVIHSVVCRITTTITTATDWSVGDGTTAARFCAANSTLTAGTTTVCLLHRQGGISTDATGPVQTAAASLRITTTGTPGAGVIRCTVFAESFTAPTS